MSPKDPTQPAHGMLRSQDRPCDWMTAGLVRYKLCDRDGDCDRCPFDAAMRGRPPEPTAPFTRSEATVERWQFPDDRQYHRGHVWVQQRAHGVLRCGIDAFVVQLLPPPSRVVLPAALSHLNEGLAAAWLCLSEGLLAALLAPASGTVQQRNPVLGRQPTLVMHSPYQDGWLYEMTGALPTGRQLMDATRMRDLAAEQRWEFQRQLHAHITRRNPSLAPLAADGGEVSPQVVELLGRKTYRSMLRFFLT